MQLEDYFDFLAPNDIHLKGYRVGIETLLYDYIYRSHSPEEIQEITELSTEYRAEMTRSETVWQEQSS
jgi:hypothetical protein